MLPATVHLPEGHFQLRYPARSYKKGWNLPVSKRHVKREIKRKEKKRLNIPENAPCNTTGVWKLKHSSFLAIVSHFHNCSKPNRKWHYTDFIAYIRGFRSPTVSLLGLLQAPSSLLCYYHVLHNSTDRSIKRTNTPQNTNRSRQEKVKIFVQVIMF